jgi:hypothetical protein
MEEKNVEAQTVVSKASYVEWDDPNPVGIATRYRIYLSQTPGVVVDGVSFIAEVQADTCEPSVEPGMVSTCKWIISSSPGSYFVVVTLVNDDGMTIVETGPSNEDHYTVPGPPENAEAVR